MASQLARDHGTVILSGDGGGELVAGDTRDAIDRRRNAFSYMPGVVRKGMMQPLISALPHGALGRNFIYNVSLDPIDRYLDSVSIFTQLQKRSLDSDHLTSHLPNVDGVLPI